MENRVLTIDNVRLSFPVYQGQVNVLNNISLHIDRGEIVGVVGESGSGKSVTAMLAMRLLPAGSYHIHRWQTSSASTVPCRCVKRAPAPSNYWRICKLPIRKACSSAIPSNSPAACASG